MRQHSLNDLGLPYTAFHFCSFQPTLPNCIHRFLGLHAIAKTLAIIGFGWMVPLAIATPGFSAERIYVTYNILERSIAVASLAAYAKDGTIDDDLAAYARFANPGVLKELRTALTATADLKPVTVAQFLYSPQGESALKRLGQVILPDSGVSGYKAIRAALILATADPQGLSLLTFLKHFPAKGIRVNVDTSLRVVAEAERLLNQSRKATQTVTQLAEAEAIAAPLPTADLPDLRRRGRFQFQKQSVILVDPTRRTVPIAPVADPLPTGELTQPRTYPIDLYIPAKEQSGLPQPIPVVVISHGLGSDRTSFAYLAEHLASHGFAVLVPEHPGSDRKQMEALLAGIASEVAEPTEFINRPLDITALLNYMEQQAKTNPSYQALNLKQVGVIGQSFGGYTALALAGAPISFSQLQKDCQNLDSTFNLSLLLQCRARALQTNPDTQPQTDFRDPRVQAVIAVNPIDSAVLGQASLGQITLPTMIIAGSADTVSPSLFEQIQPFTWLTTRDRYLVQMDPGTHFSVIGGGEVPGSGGALVIPPEVIGPNPAIAQRYVNALALAFFQTHIANRSTFRPYLSAAYANAISESPLQLDLIRNLSPSQVSHLLAPFPLSALSQLTSN